MNRNLKNSIFLFIFLFTTTFCCAQNYNEHEQYFLDFTVHQMATQNRIKLLQNKSNLKKVGTEVVNGKISGTLTYETKIDMKKMAGIIYMTWENYSDEEGWIFNGQIITNANSKGDGTLSGTMTTSGNYEGHINFNKLIIKDSKAADGVYIINLNDKEVEVPYSLFFIAIPDSE